MSIRWGGILALVVGLALCVPLHAARAEGELERHVREAVRLYEKLDYELALERLAHARKVARGPADEVTLSLYEGIIRADLGRWEEARAAFQAALRLEPGAKLPLRVSPKVRREFATQQAKVRAQLAQRKKAPLEKDADEEVAEAPSSPSVPEPLAVTPPASSMMPLPPYPPMAADRPEVEAAPRPTLVPPSTTESGVASTPVPPLTEEVREGRTPVVPWVLLGVGVAAGGAGAWFGLSSRGALDEARGARLQDDMFQHHAQAQRSARTANILFGAAGAAAAGALVTWLLSGEPAPERAPELSAYGDAP